MIAFVVPWYGDNIPGGAEAASREITNHLFEAGIEVEILTTTVEKFTADWNKDYYKPGMYKSKLGIPIRRFAVKKRDARAFDIVNLKLMHNKKISAAEEEIFLKEMVNSPDMYRYIRENKDRYQNFVFLPYMFGTTYWGVRECLEKAVLIPCFHDESYLYLENFKQTYSKVAGMLFNAEPEAELAKKVYNIDNVKTKVMGLGVNINISYDAERFCRKYGVTDDFILYAGRKDEGKNIYTLLRYFEYYKKSNPNRLKLVLIGGGDVIIPDNVSEDVYDFGFVEIQDKYDAYAAAKILCQPSKNESFSYVIMESWLCGRPVIVHEKCPVTKNFVTESNGGLYFDSYYEFEAIVNYILENRDIADIMGENGRKYVMDNFAWDVIVRRYIEFFEELK